jgi:pyrroline-5-carboxylate reductase
MKIGVLGSGDIGTTLAAGFVKHGHQVALGTRDISKLNDWQRDHQAVTLGSFADAAKFAELAVLAAGKPPTWAKSKPRASSNLSPFCGAYRASWTINGRMRLNY